MSSYVGVWQSQTERVDLRVITISMVNTRSQSTGWNAMLHFLTLVALMTPTMGMGCIVRYKSNRHFYISSLKEAVYWPEARRRCIKYFHGDLVSVHSPQENSFLASQVIFRPSPKAPNVFIQWHCLICESPGSACANLLRNWTYWSQQVEFSSWVGRWFQVDVW